MIIVKTRNQRGESAWRLVFSLAGGLLIASIILCGIIYSKTVGLRHEILSYESTLKAGRTENAELKSALFRITDPQVIEEIAAEKGLIEDTNPQWVFVSSL